MKFGPFPLSQILGAILVHSVRLPSGNLKKGRRLTEADIKRLSDHDISYVTVAIADPDDRTEDEVAGRIAAHISGDHISCADAFTGRVNLYAAADGAVTINEQGVNELNHMDEAITLATIAQEAIVHKGQLVATVKIIPFCVQERVVKNIIAEAAQDLIAIRPFISQKAVMVQTLLDGTVEKLLAKTKKVMTHRLNLFAVSLNNDFRCAHEEKTLATFLENMADGAHDMTLIMGASAITDRRDVIPAAIIRAGGEIIHYGMPVDPGNLMLLAKLRGKWVLGLPGCSRSPKLNGIDVILSRICSGLEVTRDQVMNMGVGGLLSEYPGRPQPREKRPRPREKKPKNMMKSPKKIAALVLAAGQSKRMGRENKLLLPYEQGTVLSHVLGQINQAGIGDIYVITGHEKDLVEQEVRKNNGIAVYNDLYEEGLSTSVKAGIAALPKDTDAVMIILGDMPNISADILRKIMAAYNVAQAQSIIIPTHNGKRGNPILWDADFFGDFERLEGDMGAKILLNDYPEYITELETLSDAIFLDIDTIEAYDDLKKQDSRR